MLCNVSSAHIYLPSGTLNRITFIDSARMADTIADIEHDSCSQSLLIETQNWRWLNIELGRIKALEKDLSGL